MKKVAKVLLIIILLLIVIGFFLPGKYSVERSAVMNAPASVIFEQVNTLTNLKKWSPWIEMDPEIKMSYNEIPSGVGAKYSWESKKLGRGSETILESKPNELVATKLVFEGQGDANAGFRLEPEGTATKVTWYLSGENGRNPLHRWMSLLMMGSMNSTFDKGLATLKTIVETMPATPPSAVIKTELIDVQATHYLAVHDTASIPTISEKLGKNYGMVMAAMSKQKLTQSGAPFAIYYSDSQTNWELDAGIPVDKAGKGEGSVKPGEIKAGKAVVSHYFGAYEGTGAAHNAASEFIKANNKKVTGAPWEVYITDPMAEKDTTKWATDVYYPVE